MSHVTLHFLFHPHFKIGIAPNAYSVKKIPTYYNIEQENIYSDVYGICHRDCIKQNKIVSI